MNIRWTAILLATAMVWGLCACGAKPAVEPTAASTVTTTTAHETTVSVTDPSQTDAETTVFETETSADGSSSHHTTVDPSSAPAKTDEKTDPWGGATKPTTAKTTVTATTTTARRTFATTGTVEREERYQNEYGIYHTLKGYCYGTVIATSQWMPVIGYSKDGRIVDTLFESTTIMPSPVHVYWGYLNTRESWDEWRVHTYKNLYTLNAAAKKVQEQIGLKSYRVKVFLSLFNPSDENGGEGRFKNWGELNGTAVSVADEQERFDMIKYMVDAYIAEFKDQRYKNVELAGFYWFDEYINEEYLSWYKQVTDYIRSRGYITMISPFYKADGWELCDEAGFDLHSMQSNYFPTGQVGSLNCGTDRRLTANAELINQGRIGGIEMEMDTHTAKDAITGFKKTMKVGVQSGIVNGYHVHYYGGGPLSPYHLSRSNNAYYRSCYDELYLYMKNRLKVSDIWLEPIVKEQQYIEGGVDWV